MRRVFAALIFTGFLFVGLSTADAINYSYTYLDVPGEAVDMNDTGTIVGSFQNEDKVQGFLFKNSSWIALDPPNIASYYWHNHVTAVNNSDKVVGWYLHDIGDLWGYSYENGVWDYIPWRFHQRVYDVNDAGIIVGFDSRGFSYDGADFTDLIYSPDNPWFTPYRINDQGIIVGSLFQPSDDETRPASGWYSVNGDIWTNLDYPGATGTTAWEINNPGTIVGQYTDSAGKIHAFRFNGTNWVSGDYPGAVETIAYDINDKGLIVGSYVDAGGRRHGFSYINGVWSSLDYPGATDTSARLVNNNGVIVGSFTGDGQEGQFLAKPMTTVKIDIKPYNLYNQIYYKSTGVVPVAILSSRLLKAYDVVDRNSLTFGHTGDEASLSYCSTRYLDVNYDGYPDLTCYFSIPRSGFACGDFSGTLKGEKKDGMPIEGKSYIRIMGCY